MCRTSLIPALMLIALASAGVSLPGCGDGEPPLSQREELLVGEWDFLAEQKVFHFYPDRSMILDAPAMKTVQHGKWKLEDDVLSFTYFERIEDGVYKENLLKAEWVHTVRELTKERLQIVPGIGTTDPRAGVLRLTKNGDTPSAELAAKFEGP